MDGQTDRKADRQMIGRQKDGQTDRKTDGQMIDRQRDGRTYEEVEIKTDGGTEKHAAWLEHIQDRIEQQVRLIFIFHRWHHWKGIKYVMPVKHNLFVYLPHTVNFSKNKLLLIFFVKTKFIEFLFSFITFLLTFSVNYGLKFVLCKVRCPIK
jgi:hypothetical protein